MTLAVTTVSEGSEMSGEHLMAGETHGAKQISKMGRNAPLWRRTAYRLLASHTFCRSGRTEDGVFDSYVSGGTQLSVLSPGGLPVDPVHRRFITRWVEPSSIVWDVGGNMGLFAFPAALKARAGHVYSFEPDIELANNLLRSMRRPRNRALPVTVLPFALSNSERSASFLIAAYGKSMNKLDGVGAWHDDLFVTSEKRVVATLRMDTIAATYPRPTVIKIDVEGAEMLVLEGGRKTIEEQRPVMLIEGPEELAHAMKDYFKDLDYVFLDGTAENPAPLETTAWDTVAVPRERWLAVCGRA